MRKIIRGYGPKNSDLVFVGEAPGAEEDKLGIPFVGKSGKLLRKLMNKVGINDRMVYITNLVKFRPPNNRAPTPKEIKKWGPILMEELAEINPRLVVAIGKHASQYLLNTKDSISNLRGNLYQSKGHNITAIFHPSYILRNPSKIDYLKFDLEVIANTIGLYNGS